MKDVTLTTAAYPIWLDQVTIRHVRSMDLMALEWDGEFAHFRKYYADAFNMAQQGKSILWVAELDQSKLIGQLFVQLNSGRKELADGVTRAYIYGFRIRPAYRGYGLGQRMMEVSENDLILRGLLYVTLNVSRDNYEARRLYEKLGYRIIAPEPGRWSYIDQFGERQEVDEPAWRMEKHLNSR